MLYQVRDEGPADARDQAQGLPEIDSTLVRRLIAAQFPQWAGLPVRPVVPGGWDNRTFRLGDHLTVRLPSGPGYAAQVHKEHRWLPVLAPHLPLPIPTPLAKGVPADDYPYHWSVYRWIDGQTASADRIDDLTEFAASLAGFLVVLQRIEPTGGPAAGPHSWFRGGPLQTYDAETRRAIEALDGRIPTDIIPTDMATAVWETALAAAWREAPVWFHGDVAVGNLLVEDGRLAAVIDFGCSGVGDPACDVTIAWTLLSGDSREVFRAVVGVDPATWARGRGWALWKALITLEPVAGDPGSAQAASARHVLDEIFTEYRESI
jgi:aminoglycoside phosphotransferase (APT) family kinase protein